MERHVRTYKVRKGDGSVIEVAEYQEFVDVTSISDTAMRWAPGISRLELDDGSPVNFIDESTFEVVGSGERLSVI